MDGRLAVKIKGEKTSPWQEFNSGTLYRNPQPATLANSLKKSTNLIKKDVTTSKMDSAVKQDDISGSLAEVYEKALTNVLNIQPTINMEDTCSYGQKHPDKKLTDTHDPRYFLPPEFSTLTNYRHPSYYRHNDPRFPPSPAKLSEGKKFGTPTRSAFHVPEKRRLGLASQRPALWTPKHRYPYPVNYPGDYYPVVSPSAFYARATPYHGAFMEHMSNFYPGPRRHEYPVFSQMLPWTAAFERDYKPVVPGPGGTNTRWMMRSRDTLPAAEKDHGEKTPGDNDLGEKYPEVRDIDPKYPRDKDLGGKHPGIKDLRERCPGTKDLGEKYLRDKDLGERYPRDKEPMGNYSNGVEELRVSTSHNRNEEETADNEDASTRTENEKHARCERTTNNVKTRRMRAFQKRNELAATENKKTASFESPKEEFLFCLGLTRVQ